MKSLHTGLSPLKSAVTLPTRAVEKHQQPLPNVALYRTKIGDIIAVTPPTEKKKRSQLLPTPSDSKKSIITYHHVKRSN